ncbi:hypothetical protein NUSPORA_00684 [Nucleospora cyclopteri]
MIFQDFLEYEKEILKEINEKSTIVVPARGISTEKVIYSLLELYANEFCLAFVINASSKETSNYILKLQGRVTDVTNMPINKRSMEYKAGGIFFGTSRTFITDFVNKNLNISKISTIFVLNAEEIEEFSTEAFILHIFRESNSLHLVKAFVNAPIQLNFTTSPKICSALQCSKMIFLPRFNEKVDCSLSEINLSIIYLKQSNFMKETVILLIDVLEAILSLNYTGKSKISYKDAFLYHVYLRNRDVEKIMTLLNILYNCDALALYTKYKKIFITETDCNESNSWSSFQSAHILYDQIKEYLIKIIGENKFKEIDELSTYYLNDEKLNDKTDFQKEETFDFFYNSILSEMPENSKIKKLLNLLDSCNGNQIVLVQNRFVKKWVQKTCNEQKVEIAVLTHSQFKSYNDNFDQIILLNNNLGTIRKLEYLRAVNKKEFVVYLITYKDSLEEEIYYNELLKEREVFERLIKERSKMPLKLEIEYFDIDSDDEDNKVPVIIDSRETRAKLPFYLYKAKNPIEIKTLLMGDYEINLEEKRILIERKSVTDFKASINSNRLYQQGVNLQNNCKHPFLLLEFDQGIPTFFNYENYTLTTTDSILKSALISKFCVFLLAFPKIRILWSNDNLFATKIIRDFQNDRNVLLVNKSIDLNVNPVIYELLLSIPGINQNLIPKILSEFNSIEDLAFADLIKLQKIFSKEKSKIIYDFFRQLF